MKNRLTLVSASATKVNQSLRLSARVKNKTSKAVTVSHVGFAWRNKKEMNKEHGDFSVIEFSKERASVEISPHSELEITEDFDPAYITEAPIDYTSRSQVVVSYDGKPLFSRAGLSTDTFERKIEVNL